MGKRVIKVKGWLKTVVFGHVLNPIWRPRMARRKRRSQVAYDVVSDYLRLYDRAFADLRPHKPLCSETEPERVFTIWLQGEENAPDLVKACIKSMRRNLSLPVVVIDRNNLFDWISLPDYIVDKWEQGKISNAHFSDICRVELLFQHGGLWFDATDYVTSDVPQEIMEQGCFLLMAGENVGGAYSKVQNCFLRAKKGDAAFCLWSQAMMLYWWEENRVADYYVHQPLFHRLVNINSIAAAEFAGMPRIVQDPTHRLWYGHFYDSYDEDAFKRLTDDTFFQKTSYKDSRLKDVKPGTMAHHILYS